MRSSTGRSLPCFALVGSLASRLVSPILTRRSAPPSSQGQPSYQHLWPSLGPRHKHIDVHTHGSKTYCMDSKTIGHHPTSYILVLISWNRLRGKGYHDTRHRRSRLAILITPCRHYRFATTLFTTTIPTHVRRNHHLHSIATSLPASSCQLRERTSTITQHFRRALC